MLNMTSGLGSAMGIQVCRVWLFSMSVGEAVRNNPEFFWGLGFGVNHKPK